MRQSCAAHTQSKEDKREVELVIVYSDRVGESEKQNVVNEAPVGLTEPGSITKRVMTI